MHLQVYCMFEIFGNENVRLFALSSSVLFYYFALKVLHTKLPPVFYD
jgi:hypothetical protein